MVSIHAELRKPGVNDRNVVLMLIIHKVTKSPRQMQVNTREPQGGKTNNLEDGHHKEEETTRGGRGNLAALLKLMEKVK